MDAANLARDRVQVYRARGPTLASVILYRKVHKNDVESKIATHDAATPARVQKTPSSFAALAGNLEAIWSAPTADARLKKRIVRTVIQEVVAAQPEHISSALPPLATLEVTWRIELRGARQFVGYLPKELPSGRESVDNSGA
jgi:hypothetical protein